MSEFRRKATILWLSDFHFNKEFKKLDSVRAVAFKNFLKDFFESVTKFKDQITHVILTGDIAYNGDNRDYNAFDEMFFIPLINTLHQNIHYMVIPGNHDIEWSKFRELFDKFKKQHKESTDPFTDFFSYSDHKIQFLKNEKDEYLSSFLAYIERLTLSAKSNKIHFYSNSFIDKKAKIRFLLINSILNSYGEIPKNVFFNNFNNVLTERGLNDAVYDLVYNRSELFSQVGQQTYLFEDIKNTLNHKEFSITDDNEFITLSLAHHNTDWLHWDEKHSKSLANPIETELLYRTSNLHLVGHEHSRPGIGCFQGNCLTLNAGMFLDNSLLKGTNVGEQFPNNWYTILEINDSTLSQKNFHYNVNNGNGSWIAWEEPKEYELQNNIQRAQHGNIHPNSTFIELKNGYLQIKKDFERRENEEKNKLSKCNDEVYISYLNRDECKNFLLIPELNVLTNDFKKYLNDKGVKNYFRSFVKSEDFYIIFIDEIILLPGIMELILESAANGSKSFFNQLAESLKMSNSKIQKLIFPDIYITNIDLDLYMGSSVYEFATKRISGILETRKNKFLLFQQQFLSSLQSMSLAPSFFDSHSKPEFIHFLIDKKEFISNSADEPPPA